MRTRAHPLSRAIYDVRDDGNVEVDRVKPEGGGGPNYPNM